MTVAKVALKGRVSSSILPLVLPTSHVAAYLLSLPNELLGNILRWLAPLDVLQLRGSSRGLAHICEKDFAQPFECLHVVLHPLSIKRLKELSGSTYAPRVKQLMISTHLLQHRETLMPSWEQEREYRILCAKEQQAIGNNVIYDTIRSILEDGLLSVEVVIIADYEDTWACANTGFVTGNPMGRQEILLRTGQDITGTPTLKQEDSSNHWGKHRNIMAYAATATADFARSSNRSIHIDIAYDHTGPGRCVSSSLLEGNQSASEWYQLLSTDMIRCLSQCLTPEWPLCGDFGMVGMPNPSLAPVMEKYGHPCNTTRVVIVPPRRIEQFKCADSKCGG